MTWRRSPFPQIVLIFPASTVSLFSRTTASSSRSHLFSVSESSLILRLTFASTDEPEYEKLSLAIGNACVVMSLRPSRLTPVFALSVSRYARPSRETSPPIFTDEAAAAGDDASPNPPKSPKSSKSSAYERVQSPSAAQIKNAFLQEN